MRDVKIIPCLDIKEGGVVKGIKLVNLKDARDPAEAAQIKATAVSTLCF